MFITLFPACSENESGTALPHSKTLPHNPRALAFRPGFGVRQCCAALFSLVILAYTPGSAPADDLSEKGRAVFKKNQHTVVTVQLVLKSKVSFGGRGGESNESRQDVTGTIVDPSGLAVLSL